MSGMVLVLIEMLKILVRYLIQLSPRCLRWRLEILSDPAALKALQAFMAFLVSM